MTSTVLYSYNGDILDLIGWFSIFNAYGRRISREFPMFFYIFLPLESSHSALHRRCTWKSCRNSLCTRRSTARWSPLSEIFGWEVLVQLNLLLQIIGDGIYIYILYYIYILCNYVLHLYVYIYDYIYNTYVRTYTPTYLRT